MKNQNRIQTRAKWLLSLGALLATGVSSAWAFTPAGTEIRNQSTATYLDAANTPQIATSNEVINTVAPLYSVVVTPNATGASGFFAYDGTPALTQVSAPGNVAYYSYILENTGNAPDRFNADVRTRAAGGAVIAPSAAGIEIYYDANGNGFVDAGDVLLDNSLAGSAASTPIVNPGQKIPLVVAVHTPSAATAAQRIETDFQVTGVNGAAQDAASNWNRTTFAPGVGVVTAYKSADVTSAAPGRQDVTYTIQGSNTGSAAVSSVIFVPGVNDVDTTGDGTADIVQGILIEDVLDITKIDVGADYANINPITTGGQISPSTAVPLFWDDANSLWTATKPTQAASTSAGDIGKYKIALFIPDADSVGGSGNGASDPVLSPGQSYRMSFTVDIRSGIAATTLENEVSGQYISGGITRDFESNVHIIEIGGDSNTTTVDVELSPYTFLNGTTANLSAITNGAARGSLQHPGVDALGLNASADTTSAGSELDADAHRNAGTTVVFPLTLTNPVATSSATDVFNISIVSGVPAGWTATLFKADGITPLADTNGDSRPDVGEVVPGGVVDLVVKVVIPDNSPAVPGASTITVQATSVKKSLGVAVVSDTTILRIPEVRPAGVDIAVRGQVSGDNAVQTTATATADDDDDATGTAVQPGSNVAYAIQVANIRNATQNASGVDETTSAVDTYQLTVTKVGGAAPFDVVLFRDLNGDGVLDASELNPISDTGFLSPVTPLTGAPLAVGTANLFNLLARVTVPSETPAGDYFVDVTATSTNRSAQVDTMRLLVRVVAAPSISVIPDNTATVVRGGSVTFKHIVVNTGNTTGTVQLSTAFPAGLFPTGYTAVFVSDTGAILGTDGVTYVTPSLAPNQSQEFYVRIFVPANASVGATVPLTITGSGTAGGATLGAATDDAVDIITVIDGSLDLQKTNSPTGAVLPGGTIGYTTVFKNLGGASITDVVVFDAIPANSTFVATSLGTSGLPAGVTATLEYSTNNGVSWTAVEPAATSVTNVRVKLVRTAALGVPLNGLLPGESGSFTFQVTVK